MKKPQFVEDQIYHVYNRGVEKRNIFSDSKDYLRFVHDLFEFNDEDSVPNMYYYFNSKTNEVEPHYVHKERKTRKLLVDILAFELMQNHFHLLLTQRRKHGIVRFMQKLGTGYTMYFNKKYKRVGGLCQGRFKAVHVTSHSHLLYIPFYIHANPLLKKYRGSTSLGMKSAMKYLKSYRWSSFPDYIGKKNFPSVTNRKFILDLFGGVEAYRKETQGMLREWGNTKEKLGSMGDKLLDSFE